MKKVKNVVLVNDFDYVQGGASKIAIDTANALATKSNCNVYFFSGDSKKTSILNDGIIKVCTNQGECMRNSNWLVGMKNGIYNTKAKKILRSILRNLNPSETIIHVHGWTKCLSSSVFDVAFKMGFKVVLTLHDYFSACPNGGFFLYPSNKNCFLQGGSFRCFSANCDSRNYFFKIYRNVRFFVQNKIVKLNKKIKYVIYISEFSWEILKDYFESDVYAKLIYNPIDMKKSSEKANACNGQYFLYVGRISKEKGVDVFCEAVKKAKVEAIVVGDGDQKNYLEKKYPCVKFVGWKKHSEVNSYIRGAKALVFPSRWYETAGLTAIEARVLGVPSIVSSNTAAIEFVQNKNNIFENGNVDSLVKILKEFDFKRNKEKNTSLDTFSCDNYYKNLLREYEVIIND